MCYKDDISQMLKLLKLNFNNENMIQKKKTICFFLCEGEMKKETRK